LKASQVLYSNTQGNLLWTLATVAQYFSGGFITLKRVVE